MIQLILGAATGEPEAPGGDSTEGNVPPGPRIPPRPFSRSQGASTGAALLAMLFFIFKKESILLMRLAVAALVATLALLNADTAMGQDPSSGVSSNERDPQAEVKILRGEALLISKDAELVIAVDEADQEGVVDGKVDHLLYMLVLDLGPHPFVVHDALAEIEIRRSSLRAILPTTGQDLRFRLYETEEVLAEPLHLGLVLVPREFIHGARMYEHHGEKVQELTLKDVERAGPRGVLASVRPTPNLDVGALGFTPLKPPADPDDGGTSCKSSCTATCDLGSCSSSCLQDRCSSCMCLGEPSGAFCLCY